MSVQSMDSIALSLHCLGWYLSSQEIIHSSCPCPPGWQDLQLCLQHVACSVQDMLRHVWLPSGCHHRFLGAP